MARANSSTSRLRAQLAPEGQFELPKINLRYVRPLLIGIAALLFMGSLILGLGLLKNDPPQEDPNALWIGSDWTYATPSDNALESLSTRLRENRIGTVYAHVSELNVDNSWTGDPVGQNRFPEVEQNVGSFASQFKRQNPNVMLYGTVRVQSNLSEDGYRLDDESAKRAVGAFSAEVIELGFDGVMLDIDPVWNGDTHFLDLLRETRQAIGGDALLAAAVPPDWTPVDADIPISALIEPGTVWDREYKQRVALIQLDQLVLRNYNSYLTDDDDYAEWSAYQVATFAEAIYELQTDTRLLIGVPAYEGLPPAHDPQVEHVAAALRGIERGLTQAGEAAAVVEGLALYAEWDIGDADWQIFRNNWVERS
jgi:hypothetical protein